MKNVFMILVSLGLVWSACNNAPEKPAVNVGSLLEGEWQSVSDAKSQMEIKGATLSQVYAGKVLETRKFAYTAKCEGNACGTASGNKLGCYTSSGEADIECYAVVSITDSTLEVSMAGASGATLTYKKLEAGAIKRAIELAEDAIDIEVPTEFLVEINEKGEVKVMGQSINPKDFEKVVTEHFEGYRAMGAKTMPPYKSSIQGTVTMGVRNEFETMYNNLKKTFENLN